MITRDRLAWQNSEEICENGGAMESLKTQRQAFRSSLEISPKPGDSHIFTAPAVVVFNRKQRRKRGRF